MKYRALTVSSACGSGGEEIAEIVARFLGWRLVDKGLINEISRRAQVSLKDAAALDEKVDPWIHRITRPIWGKGADGISQVTPVHLFDAEEAAFVTRSIIEEAYEIGNCVIVGRGSQCILQGKDDVFHTLIYGRLETRVRRVRSRVAPGTNANQLVRLTDSEHIEYIRFYHKMDPLDPNLYDLMIDSKEQPEKIARVIISVMRMVPAETMAAAS